MFNSSTETANRNVPIAPLAALIVESHPLMRAGLGALLGNLDFVRLAAEASGGYAAMMACRQKAIDLALLGQTLDDIDVVEAAATLLQQSPTLRIVVCFDRLESREVAALLQAGVSGLVSRSASKAEFEQALRTVAAGGAFMPAQVARGLFQASRPNATLSSTGLSDRELEVLRLIALGYSNKDIARTLTISVRTVETHRFNLRQKSGASRPRELTRLAQRLGLLTEAEQRNEPSRMSGFLKMTSASAGALALAAVTLAAPLVAAAPVQAQERIVIMEQDLGAVLTEFAHANGLRPEISSDLRQRVSHQVLPGDAKSFLEQVNREFDVVAYVDGDRLIASAKSDSVTRLIPLGSQPYERFLADLKSARLPMAAVKLNYAESSRAVFAIGPASVIASIVALMETQRAHQISSTIEIVRYGKHTD